MTTAETSRLFETLDVLDDPVPRPGALNMALDEILLGNLEANPLLRIYRWDEPTVSFGYFEPWRGVAALYPSQKLVRRWTGGGAVAHGEDFTYSLLVPRSHPLTNFRAGESYRLIHLALRTGFQRLGMKNLVLTEAGFPQTAAVRRCFSLPVQYDLLAEGMKVGGAAQRRTRSGLLHQGSVRLTPLAPRPADFAAALPAVLSKDAFGRQLHDSELTDARRLAETKYTTQAWLRRC